MILKISIIGHMDTRRILNETEYAMTCHDLGIALPVWNQLKRATWGFDDLRINLSELEVLIYQEDEVYHFRFHPGYITDLASVPKWVRSFIDNDDKRLLVAAYVHDALFLNHWLSFRDTNKLFRKIIRNQGGGPFLAGSCWLAVSSFVGRRRYNMHRPEWSKKYCDFRKIQKADS